MKRLILITVLSILFISQICSASMIATDPNPVDKMIDVDVTSSLTWTNASQTKFVNVYLNDILENSFPVDLVVNHLDVDSYIPLMDLNYNITYVWRVDSIKHDKLFRGDQWEFTTQVPELPTIILFGMSSFIFIRRR